MLGILLMMIMVDKDDETQHLSYNGVLGPVHSPTITLVDVLHHTWTARLIGCTNRSINHHQWHSIATQCGAAHTFV